MKEIIIEILVVSIIFIFILWKTDILKNILDFISYHPILTLIIVSCLATSIYISYDMTLNSLEYSSLDTDNYIKLNTIKITQPIDYQSSTAYTHSFFLSPIKNSLLGEFSAILTEADKLYDFASKIDDACGEPGTLLIPTGASCLKTKEASAFGWNEKYKIFFNRFECYNTKIICVVKDRAVSIECFRGWDFTAKITCYKLAM